MRTGQVTTIARFGIEQPVAFVLSDAQMITDDRELIAGHFEHRAGKEVLLTSFLPPALAADDPMITPADGGGTEIRLKDEHGLDSAA